MASLILPPYFVKLTDDEIFAHYRDVVSQTRRADPALQYPRQRRELCCRRRWFAGLPISTLSLR